MQYDVVEVNPIEHLRLRVVFRDGLTGEVRLHPSHLVGAFEPLKDPLVFSRVQCAHGFVEWPGEIDLAPDAMYDAVKKSGLWELK